jgi:hypothetical protein
VTRARASSASRSLSANAVQQIADLFNVPRTTVYGHLDSASKGTRPTSQRSRAKA